jgi:hypothetical protein
MAGWGSTRGISHKGLLFDGGIPFIQATLTKNKDENKPAKVSAAKTVALCADGDAFNGFVLVVEDGYCTVQLKGFITAKYSGADIVPGRRYLCADDAGGIKSGSVAAQGTITATDQPTATKKITIGTEAYTFKEARAAKYDVAIGADVDESLENLAAAINADSALVSAVAEVETTDTVVVTAKVPGPVGNDIVFSSTDTAVTVDGTGKLGTTTAGADTAGKEYLVTDVDTTEKLATFLLTQ